MGWKTDCDTSRYIHNPISLIQGDSYAIKVDFGQVIPNIVVRGEVRTDYQPAGSDVFDMAVTILVAGQEFLVKITPAQSATLTVGGTYVYDIEYEITGGEEKKTFTGGDITVEPQVSDGA
jgi:hypothetical protein